MASAKFLAFEVLGSLQGTKSITFLHGMLGHKRNWRSPALAWHKMHPHFRCVTVDHRGHGASGRLSGANTVEACAHDLKDLFDKELMPTPNILMAHSFGGKVALKYLELLESSDNSVTDHTWILDSIPRKYSRPLDEAQPSSSVFKVFSALNKIPSEFSSREDFVSTICREGIPKPIALWLATSITINETWPERYRLSLDKDVAYQLFLDFCELDMWSYLESYSGQGHIHFVRAGKNMLWENNHILEDFEQLTLKNPRIHLHTMPHVGHWLHTEDLPGLMKLTSEYSAL